MAAGLVGWHLLLFFCFEAAQRFAQPRLSGERIGIYGPPESLIDWCEPNHVVSLLVAEPWNSVTSLFFVAAGALGHGLHRELPPEFGAAWAAVALVGVGSVAFHATLTYEMQLLDELPMVWLGAASAVVAAGNRPVAARRARVASVWAVSISAVVFFCAISRRGSAEEAVARALGSFTFAACELYGLHACWVLGSDPAGPKDARRLFNVGFLGFLLAEAAWVVDLSACGTLQRLPWGLPNPQFHAWGWHGGTAYCFHCLLVMQLVYRWRRDGTPGTVAWTYGVPYAARAPAASGKAD